MLQISSWQMTYPKSSNKKFLDVKNVKNLATILCLILQLKISLGSLQEILHVIWTFMKVRNYKVIYTCLSKDYSSWLKTFFGLDLWRKLHHHLRDLLYWVSSSNNWRLNKQDFFRKFSFLILKKLDGFFVAKIEQGAL